MTEEAPPSGGPAPAASGAVGSGAPAGAAYADAADPGVRPPSGSPATGSPQAGSPPGRARRRRTPWRAAFFALAAVGIIVAVAWALLGDRLFVVRSVTVTGNHLVSSAQVTAAADVPLGTPLMRVNATAATQRIEAIRQVASATVTKDWPDHVAIVVTERVPALSVRMAGGGYDLVDPTGTIVRWSKTRPAKLPLLTTPLTGSALSGDPGVAAAADVLAELDAALARSVASVSVSQVLTGDGDSVVTAQQVTLALKDGKTVVWGDASDAAAKNRELTILLRSGVRYVDVSAPGTAVTR
jgi:cell division protein FtsQ